MSRNQYDNLLDNEVTDDYDDREIERNANYPKELLNHDEDVAVLIDMGFEEAMIRKVYIFLKPRNLDQAIEYMTEENGIYQHRFYESSHSNYTKCFICGKLRNAHIGGGILSNFNLRDSLERISDPIDEEDEGDIALKVKNEKECQICYCEVTDEEIERNKMKCGHVCCEDCWMTYLKTEIEQAKVAEIHCFYMKCSTVLKEDFILGKIKDNPKLIEKYNIFKEKAEILNNPNKKFCPKPNCNSYLERPKGQKNKYVKCKNGHEYCFVCLKSPHGKQKCEEELDKDFQIWRKGKVIKQCPRCKFYTEKNKGCNHMTCAECKYQWCWLCEGKYDSGHFSTGKCKGLQFVRRDYVEIKFSCRNLLSCFPWGYEALEPDEVFNTIPTMCYGNGIINFFYLIFMLFFFNVCIGTLCAYMGITEVAKYGRVARFCTNMFAIFIAFCQWTFMQFQVSCLIWIYAILSSVYYKINPFYLIYLMMTDPNF